MPRHALRPARALVALLVLTLIAVVPAEAQSPDAIAAAKQLMATMKSVDQYKAVLPTMMRALKPAVVQNRPEIERDYDALVPVITEVMNAHVNELIDKIAVVYAKYYSAAELNELDAFFRSPTGQKFVDRRQAVTQESLVIGQEFARTVATELRQRMIEELRKKGHNI